MVFYYVFGICIFYGIVNINQLLVEVMGLYLFGVFFVNLNILLCDEFICEVVCQVSWLIFENGNYVLMVEIVDEKVIVNLVVVLFVIGGLINYILYLLVIVQVVGIQLIWQDMFELFYVVLILVCIYLNGQVDINYFQVVGGMFFLIC